jgi:hypothetical protein
VCPEQQEDEEEQVLLLRPDCWGGMGPDMQGAFLKLQKVRWW